MYMHVNVCLPKQLSTSLFTSLHPLTFPAPIRCPHGTQFTTSPRCCWRGLSVATVRVPQPGITRRGWMTSVSWEWWKD